MKIIYLKELSRATWAEEKTEPLKNNKVTVQIHNTNEDPISAVIQINGHRLESDGKTGFIHESIIKEGSQLVSIKTDDGVFEVGTLTRTGSRVTGQAHNAVKLAVEAASAAERAISLCRAFEKRIQKLERSANGVDLTDLALKEE